MVQEGTTDMRDDRTVPAPSPLHGNPCTSMVGCPGFVLAFPMLGLESLGIVLFEVLRVEMKLSKEADRGIRITRW